MLKRYKLLLERQKSILDTARIKILLSCICTSLVLRLAFVALHIKTYLSAPPLALILFPLIWLVALLVLLMGQSWKTAANLYMGSLTVIIWSNVFFVQEGINIVVTQYCLVVLSCGYYLLGPKKGLIYSIVSIMPLIGVVVSENYFRYELPSRNIHPNIVAFPILIVANFLLLIYIHYQFFLSHIQLDQQKEALQNELEVALLQTKQLSAAKTNFVTAMSHQLRTPLNVVRAALDMLSSEQHLPGQQQYLSLLDFSTNNLLGTINQMTDFARLDGEQIKLTEEHFNPDQLITNVFDSFRFTAADKRLDLQMEKDDCMRDIVLSGDPLRLSQILLYLVDNAIKFTEIGYVRLEVKARRTAWDRLVLSFTVTDSGIGIPQWQLAKVLAPFHSDSSQTSRQYYGTLGLAVANQLVSIHGGKLLVESQENQGTCVSFELDYPIITRFESPQSSPGPSTTSLAGYRILVVDDEPLNILLTRKILEGWKATVESCTDGLQAIEKVVEYDYDLILMDINMPRMDGFEAAQNIRSMQDELKRGIPIVAITASSDAVAKGPEHSSHIDQYLLKPVRKEQLWEVVSALLNKGRSAA